MSLLHVITQIWLPDVKSAQHIVVSASCEVTYETILLFISAESRPVWQRMYYRVSVIY